MKVVNTKSDSPISKAVYNEGNKVLTLTFQRRGTFKYPRVSREHAHGFAQAGVSFGRHFNTVIKPNYTGKKVEA